MKRKKILTEVFVLFFVAAVFMAVYVVIEMGNDWLAVLGGAAVLLIASYLLIDYRLECCQDGTEADTDKNALGRRLDELEEVQKATYTVIKRGNGENAELLQKIESHLSEMTQMLGRLGDAASSGNAELGQVQQLGKATLDAVNGFRQDYQTGVKNLIKYEKENARQIAEKAHTNTEMTIMELNSQLVKIQECLHEQKEVLANLQISAMSVPDSFPEEAGTALEPDNEDWFPVLDDAKQAEEPDAVMDGTGMSDTETENDVDEFDAEAAIKAYMIEQGYVDAEETEASEETETPAAEPMIEALPEPEPAASSQKTEEEIANTLQGMASGDPNRALTPEEIAAMFAAIQ